MQVARVGGKPGSPRHLLHLPLGFIKQHQQPLLPGSEYATRGLGLLFLLNFVSVITAVFILEAKQKDARTVRASSSWEVWPRRGLEGLPEKLAFSLSFLPPSHQIIVPCLTKLSLCPALC